MTVSKRYAMGTIAAFVLLGLAAAPSWASLTISPTPTENVSCVANVCTPTSSTANLSLHQLQHMLASANVTVKSGSSAQDIIVAAFLSWNSGVTLTLDAYHSLKISKPLIVTGTGGLTVLSNDGGTGGVFSVGGNGHVTFASLSSPLTINGHAYFLANSVASLSAGIAAHPHGFFALANSYDAKLDGPYTPIETKFYGTLDGLGNVVSDMIIVGRKPPNTGFFSFASGTIQHVNLVGIKVKDQGDPIHNRDVGGLVGYMFANPNVPNSGILFEDYVSGSVKGEKYSFDGVGGLAGFSNGLVQNCHTKVTVSGIQARVGGLIGLSSAQGTNSYATGPVNPNSGSGGGLIGGNGGTVVASYSTGQVSPTDAAIAGGLVGTDYTPGGISNAYWDTTTSGVTSPNQGAGSPANDPGITGLTTTQLQAGLPPGFDPAVWGEDPIINDGLPYLLDNPH
jgi:hypothetical protein